jgi:hypothetical protein
MTTVFVQMVVNGLVDKNQSIAAGFADNMPECLGTPCNFISFTDD